MGHYYVEIEENNLIIGKYEGKRYKENPIKAYPFDSANHAEIKEILLGTGQENVLYYFHALYGSTDPFHKNSLKFLDGLGAVDKTISVVWHAYKIGYKKNWRESVDLGKKVSGVLQALWETANKGNTVLCHSMGHRVFKGIIENLNTEAIHFQLLLFAGADLDTDVFANNLQVLPKISEKTVVYVNKKDRLLKISSKFHGKERLGLNGIANTQRVDSLQNLEVVDVTHSEGRRFFRFTNHAYFKKDEGVIRDIGSLLKGENEKRKTWLVHKEGIYWEMK